MIGIDAEYNQAAKLMSTVPAAARVLIADDQGDVREALRLLLKAEGYATVTAATPAAVLEAVQTHEFDVLLIDLNYARDTTSGEEGLDLLTRLQGIDSTMPCLLYTSPSPRDS